jgi:hypothetical protein
MDDLREHVLAVLGKLNDGKIDIQEAGIVAKLSETVISGIKTQLEYARLNDVQPTIEFFGKQHQHVVIEQKKMKQLASNAK